MDRKVLKTDICKHLTKNETNVSDQDQLTSLVADSFLLVDLVMKLQEDHGVRVMQQDLLKVETVDDLINLFIKKASE